MFSFNEHCKNVTSKVQKRNNILKALAGTSWGQQKETLEISYKAIGRSIINYAAPVWTPNLSETNYKRLQTVQNTALRTITGCHKMSSVDHIHQETKILPIKAHQELLSAQYLAKCSNNGHPCRDLLEHQNHPRMMKHTLTTKHLPVVEAAINTSDRPINNLHTNAVTAVMASQTVNKVLNTKPPGISKEETKLPRKTRTTLAQLRSGYSKILQSYQNRLNPRIPDRCPDCEEAPHDTRHLFRCRKKPTRYKVEDLWSRPFDVAGMLGLDRE